MVESAGLSMKFETDDDGYGVDDAVNATRTVSPRLCWWDGMKYNEAAATSETEMTTLGLMMMMMWLPLFMEAGFSDCACDFSAAEFLSYMQLCVQAFQYDAMQDGAAEG